MKKILLGTSAMAGAAILAAGAAHAAEAPTMTFKGSMAYEYVFFDNPDRKDANSTNNSNAVGTGVGHNLTGNEQKSEFVWTAKGMTDGGTTYGAEAQWRYLSSGSSAGAWDEAFLFFSGDWGRVDVGSQDGASSNVPSGGDMATGTWFTDGNNGYRHMALAGRAGSTSNMYYFSDELTFNDSDSNKIVYSTPDFNGFNAVVSFTPTFQSRQATAADRLNGYQNMVSGFVGYSGTFSDVGVTIGGAVSHATAINGSNESPTTFHIGGGVDFAGFGVRTSYFDSDSAGCAKTATSCEGTRGWDMGIGYSMDALTLSANYQTIWDENGSNDEDTADIWGLGAQYAVAEGWNVYGNAYFAKSTNDLANTDTKSNILIIGTQVSF